jgi:hypothetical protein
MCSYEASATRVCYVCVYACACVFKIPSNPEEMDGAELDALQEELTADFDIGFAIKDQVIPRAVEW